MLKIALLVVCVGATHSASDKPIYGGDHDYNWRTTVPSSDTPIYDGGDHDYKWRTTVSASYDPIIGRENWWTTISPPLNVTTLPNPLHATPYTEALRNYTYFVEDIRNRMQIASRNLVTLTGVISGLAEKMVGKNWSDRSEYKKVFEKNVKNLYQKSQGDPQSVVNEVDCQVSLEESSIANIVRVLHSPYFTRFCTSTPKYCDALVLAIIETQPSPPLEPEGRLLLALGSLASTYFKDLSLLITQDDKDAWDLFVWLIRSRDLLAPLVQAISEIRQLTPAGRCPPNRNVLLHDALMFP